MWGALLGGIVLAALVVVALVQPLRFRVAMGYAWAARKAMVPVILGLSTITAVLGAAAIIEDSAVQGVRDSFVSPFHVVDGYVEAWGSEGLIESELEAFLDHPDMAPIVDSTAVRTSRIAAEGPTGLGDIFGEAWVIDPPDYARFVDFQAIDGAIPTTWGPDDAVLDERAAVLYGVNAGDELTAFVGATPVPFTDERSVGGTYNVTTVGGSGALGGNATGEDYGRRHLATFETRSDDWVSVSVTVTGSQGQLDEDVEALYLVLTYNGEDHYYYLNNDEAPVYGFYVFGEEEAGRWDVSVEPTNNAENIAVGVEYNGTVTHSGHRLPEARVETLTVRAIVEDSGTPLQDQATILVGPAAVPTLFDSEPAIDRVFLDLEDDVVHARFQQDMDRAVEATFNGGVYARDIQYQVEELTKEIELAVGPTFVAFGSLSIGAGLILVVVLVNMIVEERRRVIGTIRAVGGTRGQVQMMVLHELGVVALTSILVGLAFAALLAGGVHGLIQALLENETEALSFIITPMAILDSAGVAFVLIMAAAAFGARRALRASPNELLRDHPDPPTKRAWIGRLLAVVLSAALALPLLAWAPPAFAWLLAGSAVALTLANLVGHLVRFPILLDVTMAILFPIILVTMLSQEVGEDGAEILLFPLQGLFLVGLGSALLVRRMAGIMRNRGVWRGVNIAIVAVVLNVFALLFAPLMIGRNRSLGEAAAGNLQNRPGRQTAILAVLATSILMIVAMGLMFQTLAPTGGDEDGGFPVVGTTFIELDDAATYLADNPPKSGADPFELSSVVLTTKGARDWDQFGTVHSDGENSWVSGGFTWGRFDIGLELTDQFAQAFEFDEIEYAPGVADWDDAVRRVQSDADAVILSGEARFWVDQGEGSSYEPVTFDMDLVDGETRDPIDVVAIVPGASNFAALMHPDRFDEALRDDDQSIVFFKPKEGVTSQELAASAGSAFRSAGMDVTDMEEEFREERRVEITVQTILGLFLGLGILVGMLSLALIAQRTYRQRRGSLAIMRAIGASPERVMFGFVIEQVLVVALAIALGAAIGFLMAGSMLSAVEEDITLRINAVFLVGILGATLIGGTLVGLLPALKIRRMRLAEALRYE